jgi:hypothetical protein
MRIRLKCAEQQSLTSWTSTGSVISDILRDTKEMVEGKLVLKWRRREVTNRELLAPEVRAKQPVVTITRKSSRKQSI